MSLINVVMRFFGCNFWEKKINYDPVSTKSDSIVLDLIQLSDYKPGTIKYEDRTLGIYEKELDFSRESIEKGSKILDVGSGKELTFAKELLDLEKDLDVYCLSPDFYDEEIKNIAHDFCPQAKIVACVGQNMNCFQDNNFDYIFCLHVYEHVPSNIFSNILLEISRVLKQGGVARIGIDEVENGKDSNFSKIIKNLNFQEKASRFNVDIAVLQNKEESHYIRVPMVPDDFTSPKRRVEFWTDYILIKKVE